MIRRAALKKRRRVPRAQRGPLTHEEVKELLESTRQIIRREALVQPKETRALPPEVRMMVHVLC